MFTSSALSISPVAYPMHVPSSIFWVYLPKEDRANIALPSSVFIADYDIWHKRFGHPSREVLKCSRELDGFPKDLEYPEHDPVCPGCVEGKMHSKSFPDSPSRAQKPFDLVHSDLKEMPVLSYSKYKYIITFLDDCTSHAWVTLLCKKSETLTAFKHFHAMIKTQFNATLRELMTDYGGEYKSLDFEKYLKDNGIQTQTSVPHTHQQNGRAERLN